MNIENFLKRLDVLRMQRGWSKKKLAQATDINENTLQGYWTKKRFPKGDDLIKIASELNTTAEYLITGIQPPGSSDNPVLNDIIHLLQRFTRDELIEIRGVVRSYMMTYFRSPPPDSASFAADKT
jgi:transcriptional regulator with XRE-family HTH domain